MNPLKGGTSNITSLDDVPATARVAARQQFIVRYYQYLALAPFAVAIFVSFKLFPSSTSNVMVELVFVTLAWALTVAGLAVRYTFWGFSCPACQERFGIGENCRSCGLPRHYDLSNLFPLDLSKS